MGKKLMRKPGGSGIEVIDNVRAPQGLCPKCKTKLYLDIKQFEHDISQIKQSKCPSCGADIFTGLLILIDADPRHMSQMIQHIASLISGDMVNWLGGDK